MAYSGHSESAKRENRDSRQMSTRTSWKRPAAAVATAEAEEAAEEAEQDDVIDESRITRMGMTRLARTLLGLGG